MQYSCDTAQNTRPFYGPRPYSNQDNSNITVQHPSKMNDNS